MKNLLLFCLLPLVQCAQPIPSEEIKAWETQAKNVTIIRDKWGIPHVYGKTDGDAVFGLMYAQCEDDFRRIEMNYIEKLGRMAEVTGEKDLYNDLYLRLLIDSADAKADYTKAPEWLKKLLQAHAAGINYFLHKNPQVKPTLLKKFQPWYPLLWTDGSIGAINTGGITEEHVKNLYSANGEPISFHPNKFEDNKTGSNGFAIAPSKTASGKAILYINPHVTFYFRPEVHMVSEEGLNVYGAVTWGQFFVYQGFNEQCGWMHTSSDVDVADIYREKITKGEKGLVYQYNNELRPVITKQVTFRYKKDNKLADKKITIYSTHHGPVMAKGDGQYFTVRSSNRMMNGLMQSWQRTKATGLASYRQIMELKGNTSNNTMFADNKGNIAYWHGNYVPVRDSSYQWGHPVDGSISATEWNGLHNVADIVQVINPASGWIQNCNSTPYTASGKSSPLKNKYPRYMAPDGENFRGVNAARLLANSGNDFTLDKIIAVGYDSTLAAFEVLVPALIRNFEKTYPVPPASASNDTIYNLLKDPVALLKTWDFKSGEHSIATTLAVEWAQLLNESIHNVYINEGEPDQVTATKSYAAGASAAELLQPMAVLVKELIKIHGTWKVEWGSINRYQRVDGDFFLKFDDNKPSLPVGFAASTWGQLPSYSSGYYTGNRKRYGVGGNSFICAVEFGDKIKARSLLAGGNSSDPASPFFETQALMYTKGQFKDVSFYKEDVLKNKVKEYHPGE
jgi:acyl-homoserine lactone acylase PvdQ